MQVSICKGVLVHCQDECVTELCLKVNRDLDGAILRRGGSLLSSTALFVSTESHSKSNIAAKASSRAGGKRGRSDTKVASSVLPEGERLLIPTTVSEGLKSGNFSLESTHMVSSSPSSKLDLSLCEMPSDFSRVQLLKQAVDALLDTSSRKASSLALINSAAPSTAMNRTEKLKTTKADVAAADDDDNEAGSGSPSGSSLDFSSSIEDSDVWKEEDGDA